MAQDQNSEAVRGGVSSCSEAEKKKRGLPSANGISGPAKEGHAGLSVPVENPSGEGV
jgi:hypothetical protein